MANLLPQQQKKRIRQEYRLRFATISLLALAFLAMVSLALLVPSWMVVHSEETSARSQISLIEDSVQRRESKGDTSLVEDFEHKVDAVNSTDRLVLAPTVREVVENRPQGIRITRFAYEPSTNGGKKADDGKALHISGVASTRGTLISFTENLRATGLFSRVDLPVSNLAQDTDISFTVELTLRDSEQTQ